MCLLTCFDVSKHTQKLSIYSIRRFGLQSKLLFLEKIQGFQGCLIVEKLQGPKHPNPQQETKTFDFFLPCWLTLFYLTFVNFKKIEELFLTQWDQLLTKAKKGTSWTFFELQNSVGSKSNLPFRLKHRFLSFASAATKIKSQP